MPEIVDVSLLIQRKPDYQVEITVQGVINFSANEVVETYELSIELRGEDGNLDNIPTNDPPGDEKLYQFEWEAATIWGTIYVPYLQFTALDAGPRKFSETRSLPSSLLNEDEGLMFYPGIGIKPIFWSKRDELYAVATLKQALSSGTSNIVKGYF
ncbi:hypothetical protein [Candidatus Electronema sp. PJ]|uniref:hypothetical protein n=1 Tax=Candidatus Electronema sp. PJ TaxID=3401572 RepID=UPI003AA969B0